MKKMSYVLIAVFVLVFFSGNLKAQENGKWLDYGNGLINLSNVSRIDFGEEATYNSTAGEETTVPCDDIIKQYEEAELDEKARNDRNISCTFFLKFDFFTLTVSSNLITNASSLVSGKKELEDSISRVRSFISDDEHYLRW